MDDEKSDFGSLSLLIETLRASDYSEIPADWTGVLSEPYFVDPSAVDDPESLLLIENLLKVLRANEGVRFFSSLQFDLEDDFKDCADGDTSYGFRDYLYELVLEDSSVRDFAELAEYLLSDESFLNLTSDWFLRGSFVSSDGHVSVIWYSLGEDSDYGLFYVRDNRNAREMVVSL